MSDEEKDSLSYYLSEMYKNLNIISNHLEKQQFSESTANIDTEDDIIRLFENKFSEWMGSFYNILIYLFCTTIAFLAAIINLDVRILPITMFAFFPFYLWFTFLYSIPEIKFNNEVIFSRKDLTLKKQIKLGKSLFSFFIRQLFENSKYGITVLSAYSIFLVLILVNEFYFQFL